MKLCYSTSEEDEQEVRVELSAFAIDDAPQYAAISYTWGDQNDRTDIFVNGRAYRVGLNSWYALLQMKYHHEECFLWMDAICINQTDAQEKGFQVGLMGSIYKNALRVNICVGPHAGDSEFLVERMRWYAQLSPEALNEEFVATDTGNVEKISSSKDLLRMLPQDRTARMRASMRTFSLRPYFSRLWIIQEISLAEHRSFYCGSSLLSWRELFTFHDDMLRLQWESEEHDSLPSIFFEALLDPLMMDDDKSLVTQVLQWSEFHCSDARDRIYGVLSLTQTHGLESAIRPNYLISPFNLLLDVLARIAVQSIATNGERFDIEDAYQVAASLRIGSKAKEVVAALNDRHWNEIRKPSYLPRSRMSLQVSDQMPHVKIYMEGSVVLSRGMTNDLCASLVVQPQLSSGVLRWWSEIDRVFERARLASAKSKQVLYNQGLEVALLPHHALAGDILLTHSNPPFNATRSPLGIDSFQPCLLIRATDDPRLFAVVGQAICNPRMTLCLSADEGDISDVCDVSPLYHYRKGGHYDQDGFYEGHSWIIHFDPEDLAVLLSQDRHHADVPGTMERPPVLETSILPSEALNRLRTGVTRTPGSSFVTYNGTTEALVRLHAAIASAQESGKGFEMGEASQSKLGQTRRHSW